MKRYSRNALGFMQMLEDAGYQVTSRIGTRRQIMARQGLTKEAQIKGIRKALRNPRTPRQFRASLKKRLEKLTK